MSDTIFEIKEAEYEELYRDMYGCFPDEDEGNEETLRAKSEKIRKMLGW